MNVLFPGRDNPRDAAAVRFETFSVPEAYKILKSALLWTTNRLLSTQQLKGGGVENVRKRARNRESLKTLVFFLSIMVALTLATQLAAEEKTLVVMTTETPPVIDGFIERIWETADSAYNFLQVEPGVKEQPTEKSVAYALQDGENLYLALRCYADTIKPIACLTADEDWIAVGIDPFGSRNTAYYFIVYASGIGQDGWVLDDGRSRDDSWEGVWYRSVGLYDDRWEIELKIPFKSIRYKKDLAEWGIQFVRYSASNRETNTWTDFEELEPEMVSNYGSLTNLNPQTTGHYFEFYPEGFLRYDQYPGEKGKVKPRLSMNLEWDMTPQATLSATAYPDFAQIESDPYTLNLSQYPTYFNERRPFFIEGSDIFRMSNFGEDRGFFQPLNIFYSRRIGKLTDGEAVPILGGLKLTSKSQSWNLGALAAYTDRYIENDSLLEHERAFGVLRIRRRQFGNSELGALFSGTAVDEDDYNYAFGLDGAFRKGLNQFILQGATSDNSGKHGWGASSGYWGLWEGWIVSGGAQIVQDSFDVSDIGFTPWAGRKTMRIGGGPYRAYQTGFLRNLYYGASIIREQEPGQDGWSTFGALEASPNLRNNWSTHLELTAGHAHEADTNYTYRSADLSVWGNVAGQFLNFGANYSHAYNYVRGFVADQASGWHRVGYSIVPQVSTSLQSNSWAEWDPGGSLVAITTRSTPRVDIRLNAFVTTSLFDELVFQTPETLYRKTRLASNRVGFIFAWNFRPKSWLYVAFNDHRQMGENQELALLSTVGAIKAKYLLYF
jgi:hypothetical protein